MSVALPQFVKHDVVFVSFQEMPGFLFEACEVTFLSGGGVPQKINRDCTLNCASIPIVFALLCKINYLWISLAERVGFEPKLR